jgi:hypothetical protein
MKKDLVGGDREPFPAGHFQPSHQLQNQALNYQEKNPRCLSSLLFPPDLTPTNFWLPPKMKSIPVGQCFVTDLIFFSDAQGSLQQPLENVFSKILGCS